MYGNSALASGAPAKDETRIYQAKKFFVGVGNNGAVVKSVLKQRYWWQYGSEESFAADCDFIWTAWKKQKHIDFLQAINTRQRHKVARKQAELEQRADSGADRSADGAKGDGTKKKRKEKKEQVTEEARQAQMQVERVVFPFRLYNKLEQNKQLTNKKGVFVNMRKYYESLGQDPFLVLPLTFHTTRGVQDPDFQKFLTHFRSIEQRIKQAEVQMKKAIK